MAAIFTRRADLFMHVALAVAVIATVCFVLLIWGVPRMNYNTQVGFTPAQPVPFSHKHHVSGLGIDCRYCHASVEIASNAGMPPTETCMTCHSQIWTNAAILAPVRASLAEHQPLRWHSVYTLPDYVYFDHSIHIAKGVGCTDCHGAIGDMPLTRKATTLYMGWCLDCHRNPAPHLRPVADVFDPHWQRTATTPSGEELLSRYHIHVQTLADCSVCHR
ncbi:MAG TPA: cytochrome c3 family protein [Steroidobacteraceae bacterium]|nr:cytochrome c3 family protein [Steroidobacteraceae bacterium]